MLVRLVSCVLFVMFHFAAVLWDGYFFLHFARALLLTFLLLAHALFFFKKLTLLVLSYLCSNFNLFFLRRCKLLGVFIYRKRAFSPTSAWCATLSPLHVGSTWSPSGVLLDAEHLTLQTLFIWPLVPIFVFKFSSCFLVSRGGQHNQEWVGCSVFIPLLLILLFFLGFFFCSTLQSTPSSLLRRLAEVCLMLNAAVLQLRPSGGALSSSRGGRRLPLHTYVGCANGFEHRALLMLIFLCLEVL